MKTQFKLFRFGSLVINGMALMCWSCSTGFSGSKKPQPRAGIEDPNKSPEEINSTKEKGPEDTKALVFELQPAPPDSWWNNCVVVTVNDKSVDIGCSKTDGGLKPVKIDVPKEVTCAAITVQIKTYKNIGSACKTKFDKGEACNGPYASAADLTRNSALALDKQNFQWTQSAEGAESTLKFEDQPAKSVQDSIADKSKSDALGVDFNDVALEIRSQGVKVKLVQSRTGTKQDKADPSVSEGSCP